MNRTLRSRLGEFDGGGHCCCGIVVPENAAPLRDGRGGSDLIEALVGSALALLGGHRVGDEDEGCAVEGRLREAVDSAREAGATGHDRDADTAGESAVGAGHDACGGLAVGEHRVDAELLSSADHLEIRSASGYAEHGGDPCGVERLCQSAGEFRGHINRAVRP